MAASAIPAHAALVLPAHRPIRRTRDLELAIVQFLEATYPFCGSNPELDPCESSPIQNISFPD